MRRSHFRPVEFIWREFRDIVAIRNMSIFRDIAATRGPLAELEFVYRRCTRMRIFYLAIAALGGRRSFVRPSASRYISGQCDLRYPLLRR